MIVRKTLNALMATTLTAWTSLRLAPTIPTLACQLESGRVTSAARINSRAGSAQATCASMRQWLLILRCLLGATSSPVGDEKTAERVSKLTPS